MVDKLLGVGCIASGATLLMLGAISVALAGAAPDFRTVALTGTDGALGPGLGSEVEFGYQQTFSNLLSFEAPVINDAGEVAFLGYLNIEGVLDRPFTRGIWSEGGGSGLETVALEGDSAPGTSAGVRLGNLQTFSTVINNEGKIAFSARVLSTLDSLSDEGIWASDSNGLPQLIVLEGDPAPGTGDSGITFRTVEAFKLSDAGQIAFRGRLQGGGVNNLNNRGIWLSDDESGLQLMERVGNTVPPYGDFSDTEEPVLNDMGQIVFRGEARQSDPSEPQYSGYWSVSGETGRELVVISGTSAPGAGSGVTFRDFITASAFNNAGQVAFLAAVTGGQIVDFVNDRGIWFDGGDSELELIAMEGNPAPGAAPGENFSSVGTPVLNSAGQVAFQGRIEDPDQPDRPAVWSNGGGSGLELIAQQGDAAPGTDANFIAFDVNPMLNGAGQVAFRAFFDGPGSNNQGIWATDADGQLQLIVRTGILFDVNDDPMIEDLRTIRSLSLVTDNTSVRASGNEDGRRSAFNDLGQIAFKLEFSSKQGAAFDSAGIFVSNLVADDNDLIFSSRFE
ncbi:MAG: choice-of-anchor tandem repeat NxxGxxAF-containing protein [Wenzhouxiangella sp.]|nr:choice-of-anchor tandem repeat NxxGxxAF-containing protein [Wenzhouxiangella sp.]